LGTRRARLRTGAAVMLAGAILVIFGVVAGRNPLVLAGVLAIVGGWWLAAGSALKRPRRLRRRGSERPG
jgi:hypothetical protein